ncbi:MAG: GAF domain-containing sensor histidine kinase [Actinomycetes bacterium]
MYGDRSDPYAAIRRLSQRVEGIADPVEIMNAVTASIAEALRVDVVIVELDAADESPTHVRDAHRVPLVHNGHRLGDLIIGVPKKRQLSAADVEMLDELARHAATVVNAVHLTLELQQSRARLVTAREEERRRLRRDLHDGVGPSLAAMVLKLNALNATVDNAVGDELIAQLRNETKGAITEIRRLVDDLRPPALDEVGLVAALQQKATALSEAPLLIEVDGPAHLPALPAAAEVAAYRIAMEAMTNATRHARATRCQVTVAVNGALEVTIADNGVGVPPDVRPGIGMGSMRERAAELSGSCSITRRGEGGTTVRAVIPIPQTSTVDLVEATE